MSLAPLRCSRCDVDSRLYRLAPFPGGVAGSLFAVAWRCPSCEGVAIDVCPTGPVVPGPASCLMCGAEGPGSGGDGPCAGCALSREEVRTKLGLEQGDDEGDPVSAARALFAQGLHRRGLGRLDRLLQRDPGRADAWAEKAAFLQSIEGWDASCVALERALACGGPASLLVSWGVALQETGKPREAVERYDAYLRDERCAEWRGAALGNKASALGALGEHRAADEVYRRAIALEPARAAHRYNLARSLAAQARIDEALDALEAALALAAGSRFAATVLAQKATLLADRSQAPESLAAADAALAIAPGDPRAVFVRGRALLLAERFDEARAEMLKVLALDPEHADALRATVEIDEALARRRPLPWWRRLGR